MIYSTMQYKDYVWAHNPKIINITSERDVKESIIPYSGNEFQDFGRKKRIVKGIGEFFGSDCIDQYNALFNIFKSGTLGYLSLPNVSPFLAAFKSLKIEGKPKPDILTYSFEFWEYVKRENNAKKLFKDFHEVLENETLWDIAYLYDIKIETLLEINKNIKNPNDLSVGERVYLK